MSEEHIEKAYEEFQEVVGENNVSIDPGILETYTYMNGLAHGMFRTHWNVRPVCVILPETTEEVQKIVKICIKHKLKLKAHSTAWWILSLATCKNCVLLDLRRMNHLEINTDDSLVVTESYVTAGVTQVEAMKHGFQPHLVGAGPNASNLASGTSMQGTGGGTVRTSMNERNVLAVEWVTPTGEILKLGSLNTPGAGWICGDGPGPSLRGMMRGAMGNMGGNGVFTRAALKLYPWYGKEYSCKGEPPFFDSDEMEHTYLKFVVWPSAEKEAEGLYRLGEAEIIDYNNRWASGAFTSVLSTSNQEYLKMEKEGKHHKEFENGYWTFFMHAPSEKALKYRIKAFEKIMKDTKGKIIDPMEYGKHAYEVAMQNAVRAVWIAKSAYMPTSANTGAMPMTYETIDQCFKHALKISLDAKEKYAKRNSILNEGRDNCYACIDEDGHYIHLEHACLVEKWEEEAEPAGAIMEGMSNSLAKNIGATYSSMPGTPKDTIMYFDYMARIQRLIDPEGVGDNTFTSLMSDMMP